MERKREEGGNKSGPLLVPIESGFAEFEMINFWGLGALTIMQAYAEQMDAKRKRQRVANGLQVEN